MNKSVGDMFVPFQRGTLTRREFIGGLVAAAGAAATATRARSADAPAEPAPGGRTPSHSEEPTGGKTSEMLPYPKAALPPGIRSRFVGDINGLTMHVLEAGFEAKDRPCVLLLHGFPELAYSWRKVLLPLAAAGFHVVAPDQRGYGRTTGWDGDYDGDLGSFRMLNLVRDSLGLVSALGCRSLAAVVGHDFGSFVAAWCALVRPDVFRGLVLMSAPFAGPPPLPFNTANEAPQDPAPINIPSELAALDRPRKHYQWYYSTREANDNMWKCPQGVHAFLRAYFHYKSADWKQNRPFPLKSWSAAELAKLPTYYVMDRDKGMAETVAAQMPTAAEIAACKWLPDEELRVYGDEFGRTGFQGGLQWYRCMTSGKFTAEMQTYGGRTIDVPSCFIAGRSDWGIYQKPGDIEKMQRSACTTMRGCHLVDGAGHWVQQEQPERVSGLLLQFLRQQRYAT
ncbi:MAG: alpha/beta hydrolase [Thermoguttaceae bacterium]|jgi:pimeloyl-ACP methyl ester carboxylesterase